MIDLGQNYISRGLALNVLRRGEAGRYDAHFLIWLSGTAEKTKQYLESSGTKKSLNCLGTHLKIEVIKGRLFPIFRNVWHGFI